MARPRVNDWCGVCDRNSAKALGLCSTCYDKDADRDLDQ